MHAEMAWEYGKASAGSEPDMPKETLETGGL